MEIYAAETRNHPQLQGISSWERPKRYQRYRDLFEEQESIRTGHVMLQTLARAIEDMPNVTTVVYSPGPLVVPVEAKYVRDIIPRGVANSNRSFMSQFFLQDRSTRELRFIERKQHGIHHLIAAVHLTQYKGIREFRVERLKHQLAEGQSLLSVPGTEFTIFVFDFPTESHMEAGKFFFRQLHKIDMMLPLRRPGADTYCFNEASENCLANFKTLLAEATELQELALRIPQWHSHAEYIGRELGFTNVIFNHLGLESTWPRLRKMTLGGIRAKEKQLHKLISRHIDTLRELHLGVCALSSGFWANLVDEVVYGCTRITPFTLLSVYEDEVNEMPIGQLPHEEQQMWLYRGEVRVNAEGQRYWYEPGGNVKSVYARRLQPDVESAADADIAV
ncbi:hypothetical protein BDV96DRAFT_565261 [Lophiotrema nucula]|uniref:Uncharacterized protein n=1 Tax=Lophiotrema nucula TaxID=690887 RepID=A0A6A5ZM21_9PLEO|nr:hypothetical protein BDV96DRAFT_565261 [Lophiotrema nucula]